MRRVRAKICKPYKTLKNGSQYKAWRCYASGTHGTVKKDSFGNDIGCNSCSINNKILLACAEYSIKHIQTNKDKIIRELSKDIKSILSDIKIIDTTKLHTKIEEINEKKKKAINLNIEGTISKNDLMLMNEQYNSQISEIQNKIFEAENRNSIQQLQADHINSYIFEVRNIINVNTDDELLYRELIDKIIIRNKNLVEIFLNCVPFGIRINYSANGKLEKYNIKIDNIETF